MFHIHENLVPTVTTEMENAADIEKVICEFTECSGRIASSFLSISLYSLQQ